jgi:uncharacterized protein (DUF2236 family)
MSNSLSKLGLGQKKAAVKRLFSLQEKITCRLVLVQQLVQQERRQRQERLGLQQEPHQQERLQVLGQQQEQALALLPLFCRKQPKKLRTMRLVLGRVIFSFE